MTESRDYSYLKYFFPEEIYIVNEGKQEYEVVQPANAAKNNIKTKGSNQKNVVFFVDYKGEEVLSSVEEVFLEKLLGAVKMTWQDVLVINTASAQDDEIKLLLKGSRVIVSFGVINIYSKAFTSNYYEVVTKKDVCFLLSDPIHVLIKDEQNKRKLWGCLKKVFSV